MKNITLSIDEKTLSVVRRYAAENDSSVNKLVRDFLTDLADQENRAKSVRKRIRELSEHSPALIGEKNWSRSDLYES